jgi:mRNA interferase MazF
VRVPEHGDILILDFDPQRGHEQMKRRPALVLSPSAFNSSFALACVAPIASKPKGHAFEVPLPASSRVKGSVMVHQLKSLDWGARHARLAAKAPAAVVDAAIEIIKDIIE